MRYHRGEVPTAVSHFFLLLPDAARRELHAHSFGLKSQLGRWLQNVSQAQRVQATGHLPTTLASPRKRTSDQTGPRLPHTVPGRRVAGKREDRD